MKATLTLDQTAELLKVSRRTLNRKMSNGEIEYHKHPGFTGRVFFTEQQINNYIKNHCTYETAK